MHAKEIVAGVRRKKVTARQEERYPDWGIYSEIRRIRQSQGQDKKQSNLRKGQPMSRLKAEKYSHAQEPRGVQCEGDGARKGQKARDEVIAMYVRHD